MEKTMQSLELDYALKMLVIGDFGVGKSSLLLGFSNPSLIDPCNPDIQLEFGEKYVTFGEKNLKLQIWDTAGLEKFKSVTPSFYRGVQGVFMVYDITRRDTFANVSEFWAKEFELYSTNRDCIKVLVGNKTDKESARVVSQKEGMDLALRNGWLFAECSAKTRANLQDCVWLLLFKMLETPSLMAECSERAKLQGKGRPSKSTNACCST